MKEKVDVMFDLIQSHESDRQQQMVYQQAMMATTKCAPSSQNTGAWTEETTQPERNLIDVSDDDSEGEYDSEDSREVSDNEEDLEERIKLVTTDIDVDQAEEVKNVEVLETNDTEPVTVDDAVELEEVTLEEDTGSSGDVQNTTQSADNVDDEVDDSLDEEDSEDEAEEEEEEEMMMKKLLKKLNITNLK